jgi:hypothetical protein
MANKLTTAQRNIVIEALNLDKAANYSRLEYYLKQIISGREVTFETRASSPLVVSSGEAWEIIVIWSQSEGSLPVGDRKSFFNAKSRATKLLDYIQTNISGKTAEAAANYQLLLEEARYHAPPVSAPAKNPQEANLQKIFNLRRIQTEILQAGIVGKIYSNLEKSKILEGVPRESRSRVLQMFAAANQNFRVNPQDIAQNITPAKLHQLLLHTPGVKDVNQIIRLLHSESVQNTDLKTLTETIESSIQSHYNGDESKYQIDMSSLRSLSSMSPGLGSISYLVDSLNISSTPAERSALIRSIRSTIINSASSGRHLDGNSLIQNAIMSAGFPEISLTYFQSLAPYVEEIEVEQRHLLLGSNLGDHDSRLLATASLAAEIGVDLTTPWIKKGELEKITERLTGSKSASSLQSAFDTEFARGNDANLQRLSELTILMGKHADYATYQGVVGANLGYKFQEMLSKGTGNYLAVKQPIDKFTQKTWGGISNIDDIIHYPQHKLAKWIEKTTERFPWLNPGAYIAGRWVKYQTGIALKIHGWAINLTTTTSAAWIKSFAGHIGDFTEGFIKHEASWSGATTFFVQRKVGNVLDWSTKILSKGKRATTKSLKISIANTIWNGFSKIAPQLSAKMLAGSFGATIRTFLLGELTLGASVAIQVGWEAIKFGLSGLFKGIKAITDGNANNLWGMGAMALGSLFLTINTLLGGIPAAFVITLSLLKSALKIVWDLFLALLALSAIVTICIVTFFTLIWYGLISPTFNIDSGAGELAISIACSLVGQESPNESSNPKLAAGKCVYELLTKAGINPLNKGNAVGVAFTSFSTALGNPAAAAEAARSATDYLAFQCVGFDVVVSMMTGGGGQFTHAKLLDTIEPAGYNYVAGVGNCAPGDFFVDKNGDWGHTGLFVSVEGANIICLDANSDGHGLVRDETSCRWPTSRIAGCLKAD